MRRSTATSANYSSNLDLEGRSYHPEYPFWRLQNDGLWELSRTAGLSVRGGNTDAKKSELLEHNVQGGFPLEVFEQLSRNKDLARQVVQDLLVKNFPPTYRADILEAVGIEFTIDARVVIARDPEFRERVLRAYEYSCAVCGFDVRLGDILVAVEAAHIKWHQAGGPDEESNGLALCSLHHKLFDRGVLTISDEMNVLVSERAHGTKGFDEWVMAFHGKPIRRAQRPTYYPDRIAIQWHVKEVFQGPGRYGASELKKGTLVRCSIQEVPALFNASVSFLLAYRLHFVAVAGHSEIGSSTDGNRDRLEVCEFSKAKK